MTTHRRRGRRGRPEWELPGGEGLPFAHDYEGSKQRGSDIWLFTCCGCGRRLVDPPGPPAEDCSCGGTWVCHRFDPDEYVAIKRFGDPRRTDE